jgi:catechol 2,3-dioxygenase-like lactoylglutathione lyase family enzyme
VIFIRHLAELRESSPGATMSVKAPDVRRALGFYRDLLGFKLVDEFRHEDIPVYARLRAPGGDRTIALHLAGPVTPLASDGVRLYFEIREVDDFCRKLQAKGFYITQMPRMMFTRVAPDRLKFPLIGCRTFVARTISFLTPFKAFPTRVSLSPRL